MKTQIIFSEKCLEYGMPHHPESADRITPAAKLLERKGYEFVVPQEAGEDELLRAHTRNYINGVASGSVEDIDTPAYPDIFEYAKLSAGAAIMAAKTNSFSLMRPPGHHVGKSGAALGASTRGFCYFNNIAVAVRALGKITVIIDIDGHHGNGSQEIFLGDKNVTYISLHRSNFFPHTGSVSIENCFNYPLLADCGAKVYFETFSRALDDAKDAIKKAEIVAVDAGFDTRQGDLVSLGLDTPDFFTIGNEIAKLGKPTFSILEGGYKGETLGSDIDAFLRGFES